MNPFRIGMVGSGKMAFEHGFALRNFKKNFFLNSIYSPTEGNRKTYCEAFKLKEYKTLEQLAKNNDAFVVAVSEQSTFKVVKSILELNQHAIFFCEKPFGLNISDSQRLYSLLKKYKRLNHFHMLLNRRYYRITEDVKRHVKNVTGKVTVEASLFALEKQFLSAGYKQELLKYIPSYYFIHAIDLCIWILSLTDKFQKIQCSKNLIDKNRFSLALMHPEFELKFALYTNEASKWNIIIKDEKYKIVEYNGLEEVTLKKDRSYHQLREQDSNNLKPGLFNMWSTIHESMSRENNVFHIGNSSTCEYLNWLSNVCDFSEYYNND